MSTTNAVTNADFKVIWYAMPLADGKWTSATANARFVPVSETAAVGSDL